MKFSTPLLLTVCMAWAAAMAAGPATHTVGRFKEAPRIDGVLDEWEPFNPLSMSRPAVEDLRVDKAYVAWDAGHVYVGVSLHDKAIVNQNPIESLQKGDCLDFRIARTPRDQAPVRLCIAPTTADGKPAMKLYLPDKTVITDTTGQAKDGVRWAVKTEGKTWSVEAAIPADVIDIKPKVDASYPFVFVVWDRDRTDKDDWDPWWRRSEFGNQKKPIGTWPMMILQDEAPPQKPAQSPSKPQAKKPASIEIDVPRHKPCNLFAPGGNVSFAAKIGTKLKGKGQLVATVVDYFGKTVSKQTIETALPAAESITIPIKGLPRGYYELTLKASGQDDAGATAAGSKKVCFGVADITHRTAAEVRQGGYRIGMKMWYLGKAWWHGNDEWDEREVLDALCDLGLQWTRVLLQQTAHLPTETLLKEYPMNAILKVERFPSALYDEQRYGPLDQYEAKFGKGSWSLRTLPRKEPYQAWLKETLATIPRDQNVFEIWNEAWDKLSPEDLATLSNWIAEAILEVRPDAIIGPNLRGSTSKYEYDAKYIEAGGMKGMKMVALHPYSQSENRLWLREYRKWLEERTGRPIGIYITEYGSHSCPEGPAHRSEQEQARRVVHQTLALYAEGIVAMTPHWAGQREENPTYHEHWFGFIRLNQEPKPALIAHAVSARMIDTSRYVGDLSYDSDVDAMLFERGGTFTLALWARDGDKSITVEPGVEKVTLVDMVGRESETTVPAGGLKLTVGPDLIYLVGVNPALAKKVTTELDPAALGQARQTDAHHSPDAPGDRPDQGRRPTHRMGPRAEDLHGEPQGQRRRRQRHGVPGLGRDVPVRGPGDARQRDPQCPAAEPTLPAGQSGAVRQHRAPRQQPRLRPEGPPVHDHPHVPAGQAAVREDHRPVYRRERTRAHEVVLRGQGQDGMGDGSSDPLVTVPGVHAASRWQDRLGDPCQRRRQLPRTLEDRPRWRGRQAVRPVVVVPCRPEPVVGQVRPGACDAQTVFLCCMPPVFC